MQNYNFIQKFLHDFYLGNKFIKKSLYELEKILFLKKNDVSIKSENHIFITGLPRSGTTTLLNFFYKFDEFASLTYENAPFIMSTNTISKIFQSKNFEKKERYHQDGIFFDLKSPESFDEVFFSTYSNHEIKEELLNFITLILRNKNKKRYLSKNNNNYKRINLIQDELYNSSFLIPFREPLQHAYSLLSQHNLFTKLQAKNDFIIRYMNYLGHNEFGKNHSPWNEPRNNKSFSDIDYWLEQWLLFYNNVFEKFKENKKCTFICYEKLSNKMYIEKILKKLNLDNRINFEFIVNKKNITIKHNSELYKKTLFLYDKIKSIL